MHFSAAASSENDHGSELGLEDRSRAFDTTIEGSRHPAQHRMSDPPLHVRKDLTRIALIPAAVQVFGRYSKLDNEIPRQVVRLDLTSLLPP
jgi:hypothetical protein